MKKTLEFTFFVSLLIGLFSACSSAKSLPDTTSNDAMHLEAEEGKALVYVFRQSSVGFAIGLHVQIDGVELAKFYPNQFYLCALEPGEYAFFAQSENKHELDLQVEAGQKYYVEVVPKMGLLIARCKLIINEPTEGHNKVETCRLIGLNKEAQEMLDYFPPSKDEVLLNVLE